MQSYIRLIHNYQEVCFTDEQTGQTIGILAGYGAGLNSYLIPFKDHTFNLVKGYNTKAEFEKLYNNVLLAPFPNRIKDGQYTFQDQSFQLPINHVKEQHAMHGFLFNRAFVIEEMYTLDNEAHLMLTYYYPGLIAGYPFPFHCQIMYDWKPQEYLTVTINIENTGNNTMLLGLGWHPYFTFPSVVNDLSLQLNCTKHFKVDERMIPTLETQKFDAFQQLNLIGDTQLDDCFGLVSNINDTNTIETVVKDEAHNIELSIIQETGQHQFNYLQLYTPKDRKSIAIEPMTCIPNAFNNGIGLIELMASEELKVAFKLKVRYS